MHHDITARLSPSEVFGFQRELVERVAKAYGPIKIRPELVAVRWDSTTEIHSARWSADGAHFIIDVDHAVEHALAKQANAEALKKVWEQVIFEGAVTGGIEQNRIVRLFAPVFRQRGLEPCDYFRKVRHGSVRSRNDN